MIDFKPAIRSILPQITAFRRDLHAHPELSWEEERTSQRILAELQKLPNLHIRHGMAGGTGIVATINADHEEPCVLLRADMDALPIDEMSDLPYKSQYPGKMHACGHDGHTACLLGAVRVLAHFADQLPGAVKFCFQPAEEFGAGGKRMIDDGALENPQVDAAFALHGWPSLPIGKIITIPGPMLAAATPFEIDFTGRGGHAAYPHLAGDVLTAAAQFVSHVQAIRTRFIDPLDPLVISVCQIEGGHTHNVLPERCHIKGTIRALSEKSHNSAKHLLEKFVKTTATSYEVQTDLRWTGEYPVLNNDPDCARLIAEVGRQLLGDDRVITDYPPSMGGEDFAFFAQCVPAAMFRVGVCAPGAFESPGLHNPCFNFEDDAIPTGILMHCAIAAQYLQHYAESSDDFTI